MPQLGVVANPPPFHTIPSYKFNDRNYYRINDIIKSFFVKPSKSAPAKLLGRGFFGSSHVIPSKEEAAKLGMNIEKGPETIIDIIAVLYFILNVTNETKDKQLMIYNHFITTLNPDLESANPPSLPETDFFYIFDEDDEDEEVDINKTNQSSSTQDNSTPLSNSETDLTNHLNCHPETDISNVNSTRDDVVMVEGCVNIEYIPTNQNACLANLPNTQSIITQSQVQDLFLFQQNSQNLTFDPRFFTQSIQNSYYEEAYKYNLPCFPLLDSSNSYFGYNSTPINTEQVISKQIEGIAIPGFMCAHCLGEATVHFSGKYTGISSEHSKKSKNRCKMDLECFEYLLKAQNHDVHGWFDCLMKTREGINKVIRILEDSKSERVQRLLGERVEQRHVDDIMYWKDNNLISFKTVNNLRKEGKLMKEIANLNILKKRKREVDQEIESMLKITSPSSEYIGYMTDLSIAVEQILQLYRCLGGKQKPKTIYFKLCVDGREVNGKKQVGIVLVPLNLRDIFPTQSVSSVFYIGLFIGAETSESLSKTVGNLSESLKLISEKLFDGSNIKILYVSDMHNVGMTFEYDVCPFCETDRVLRYTCERRTCISGCLPFQPNEIFMCLLHIKQRMIENTIAYCASHIENKDTILENLRKLPGMELFDWRELKRRYSEYGTPTTENRATVKCSMITGDRCNMILEEYESIFNGIPNESRTKYLKLFSLLKDIISICEMKQESDCNEELLTEAHIKKLESIIIDFLINSINLWTVGVKSHYFHYIIHVPEMMRRLLGMGLSLSAISNQGFERSHLFHHSVFNRALNNGGGRQKIHPTKQLLLWQWRKVYWAIALHKREGSTYWEDKRLKAEYVWKKTQEKQQERKELKLINKVTSNTIASSLDELIKGVLFPEGEPQGNKRPISKANSTDKEKSAKPQNNPFSKKIKFFK